MAHFQSKKCAPCSIVPCSKPERLCPRIRRPLLGKRNAVVVRRIVCGHYQLAGTAKPSKNGRYVVRFPAPKIGLAAFYRAESRVLARPGSRRYVKQFARAIGIVLTGQTG